MTSKFALLAVLLLLISCFSSCYTQWMPTEGAWYCEELQMQLSFDGKESFVIIDNQQVACTCFNDRGSAWFFVLIQEENNRYPIGKEVFSAKHVELSEDRFTVSEEKTGKQYIFTKLPLR